MRWLVVTAAIVVVAPSARAASGPSPAAPIELWTRAPGRYDNAAPARLRVVAIDLDRVPLHEGVLADVQYDGANKSYRYLLVDELLARYRPAAESDTALLHFANGMIIPLPFRDRAVMERMRPAVARAVRVDGRWTTALPELRRNEIGFAEARPIRFSGNKVVVAEPWHPDLLPSTESGFSPWRHADTLVGVELVSGDAWRAQFDVDAAAHAGLEVYQHVCAFCHGARDVGAGFGWDFVDPIPVSDYRKKDVSLYYHLRYRASDAPSRGLMMPPLPFLTEKDAANVNVWLRALAAHPLNPYAPH